MTKERVIYRSVTEIDPVNKILYDNEQFSSEYFRREFLRTRVIQGDLYL